MAACVSDGSDEDGTVKAGKGLNSTMKIHRGETPSMDVDFEMCRDIGLYDEFGNETRFGGIFSEQKTIIVLVRHFLCYICKEYVEDLALIPLEHLKNANVQLVVIGPAPYKGIQFFRKETGYKYAIYCNPDQSLYKALGCVENLETGSLKNSKHVKTNFFWGVLKNTWKMMQLQQWQGDIKQQGGAFVFGPGEVVHYAKIDRKTTDHSPISDLLKVAGVQAVSFKKDPCVCNI